MFLGRWVSGLRIASAWLAGMNKMRWPTFLFWNALGGIVWAASVALGVYFLGHVAEEIIATAGPIAGGPRGDRPDRVRGLAPPAAAPEAAAPPDRVEA